MLFVIMMYPQHAYCEPSLTETVLGQLDMEDMERIAEEAGVDLSQILSFIVSGDEITALPDFQDLKKRLWQSISSDFRMIAAPFAAPILMVMPVRILLRKGSCGSLFSFICRLSCITGICNAAGVMVAVSADVMERSLRCTKAITPVIAAASVLAGQEATGGVFSALSAVCTALIQDILGQFGIAAAIIMTGVAIAGNLSERFRLTKLYELVRDAVQWGVGLMMCGYMGMLTIRGRMGAVRDGAGLRTAKYAIESAIPIIGGNVSDSLGSLLATAHLVKNALGASGVVLLFASMILPVARIAFMALTLRALSAVSEVFGDSIQTAMLSQAADAGRMFFVVSAASCLLCILLIGSGITAAGV